MKRSWIRLVLVTALGYLWSVWGAISVLHMQVFTSIKRSWSVIGVPVAGADIYVTDHRPVKVSGEIPEVIEDNSC